MNRIVHAEPTRYGQHYEVTVVAATATDQRYRVRLPAPWSSSAWIDVRRDAVNAVLSVASAHCAKPIVTNISDWMAGFAAWKVTLRCDAP